MGRIVVIGSSNTDMIISSDRLPVPGQIIGGGHFKMIPGGKGANQAIAIARMGGEVSFITKTGNDLFGMQSLEIYKSEGIISDYIFSDSDNPSGVSLIMVDRSGEKYISIAQGAIRSLSTGDIEKARTEIENASLLLMELEVPMETAEYVADIATKSGVPLILNPSPIQMISPKLLHQVRIIVPNRAEAGILTGITVNDWASARKAAVRLHEKGIETIIITLAARGALIYDKGEFYEIPAVKVDPVAATTSGDTFCGALCVGITEGMSLVEAVTMANKAASITVSRRKIPYRSDLTNLK